LFHTDVICIFFAKLNKKKHLANVFNKNKFPEPKNKKYRDI